MSSSCASSARAAEKLTPGSIGRLDRRRARRPGRRDRRVRRRHPCRRRRAGGRAPRGHRAWTHRCRRVTTSGCPAGTAPTPPDPPEPTTPAGRRATAAAPAPQNRVGTCRPPRSAADSSSTSRSAGTPSCPARRWSRPDPSLLFTVAGMVPFIPYLTGREPAPYPRATSVQKCVRTLDIEEVGKTTRHGTFFQMNGNFSFGDYFKEGAIQLRLGADHRVGRGRRPRLRPRQDLGHRLPGRRRGRRRLAPHRRPARRSASSASARTTTTGHTGAPGPAGPCSEIYVDRGPEYGPDGGPAVDPTATGSSRSGTSSSCSTRSTRCGRRRTSAILGELPKKNIDTGMGLERVAYLLQGVDNMYEIDEVAPGAAPGRRARRRHLRPRPRGRRPAAGRRRPRAQRRSCSSATASRPGNEGRGYILRRLLRRAVRSMKLLGVDDATLPELLAGLPRRDERQLPRARRPTSPASPPSPTPRRRRSAAPSSAGTTLFDTAVAQAKKAGTPALSGDQAFSPARHLRLPDRRDPRDGRRAGRDRRRAGLPRADEAAARPRPRRRPRQADRLGRRPGLPPAAGRARPDRLAGLRHPAHRLARARPGLRRRRGRRRRPRRSRRARSPASCWTGRRSTPSPAVRSPTPASSPGTAAAPRCSTSSGRSRASSSTRCGCSRASCASGAELAAEVDYDWRLSALPGALGHPRRARRAAPGARPAGAAVRLLQPAGLPAAGLRLAGRAQPAAAHRHRGRRQRRRPRRPPGHRART